jgi:hypothetical protein
MPGIPEPSHAARGDSDIGPRHRCRGAHARERRRHLHLGLGLRLTATSLTKPRTIVLLLGLISVADAQDLGEAPYLAENDAAMTAMMTGMAIKPSGDVDRDFAATMIAHHQGAIDMAEAELRHGTNEKLRRIAQEIVVDQMQEIAAMQLAVGNPPPPSRAAPTQIEPASLPPMQPPSMSFHDHSLTVRGPKAMPPGLATK